MRRFLGATGLPTAVFALLTRLDQWDPKSMLILRIGPTVVALVIVPIVWRWFVARPGRSRVGRGALAGAAVAFLALNLSLAIGGVWYSAHHRTGGDAFGEDFGNGITFLFIFGSLLMAGPLGACVGALVAWIQRRFPRQAPEEADSPAMLDGAFGGALVAVLAAPLGSLAGLFVLPRSLQPVLPHGSVDINAMLLGAWLVLIPIGAALGALGVRRWRRITTYAAAARAAVIPS